MPSKSLTNSGSGSGSGHPVNAHTIGSGSGRGSSCIENNGIRGVPVKGGGTRPKTHAHGNGQNLQIVKDALASLHTQKTLQKKQKLHSGTAIEIVKKGNFEIDSKFNLTCFG